MKNTILNNISWNIALCVFRQAFFTILVFATEYNDTYTGIDIEILFIIAISFLSNYLAIIPSHFIFSRNIYGLFISFSNFISIFICFIIFVEIPTYPTSNPIKDWISQCLGYSIIHYISTLSFVDSIIDFIFISKSIRINKSKRDYLKEIYAIFE